MTVQWSTDPLSDYPRCGDGGHSRSNHLNEPVLQKQGINANHEWLLTQRNYFTITMYLNLDSSVIGYFCHENRIVNYLKIHIPSNSTILQ